MSAATIPARQITPSERARRSANKKRFEQVLVMLCALTVLMIVLLPLFWMLVSSFKPNTELFMRPPSILPVAPTLEHYVELWRFTSFPRYFLNTFAVAGIACFAGVLISLASVYAVTRFEFIAARAFTFGVLFIYMLPPILLALPFFRIWFNLGMLNSLPALAITYLTITLPFSLWILRPYIEAIPRALEEAAMIDGCTRFQAFRKVIVPQAWPGIIASFVFTFVVVWNELLYSLVLISDEPKRTVSLGIASLILETSVYSWGLVNAAGVLATVPVLFLFALAARHMVSGLGAGAVKG
jgi:ABC-type glycerol-3-phosphate transport system permease component